MKIIFNPHHQLIYKNQKAGGFTKPSAKNNLVSNPQLKKVNTTLLNTYFGISFKGDELKYDPIVKASPVFRPVCNNYDDIDEFAEKYEAKLNSELLNPNIDDINKLISDIKLSTNADEKLILKTLYRLTQFSSYKSWEFMEKATEELELSLPVPVRSNPLNCTFGYIYFKFPSKKDDFSRVSPFFADNIWLNILEKNTGSRNKERVTNQADKVKKLLELNRAKICILDGYDVKASDGKYYSTSFLSGSGYLKSLAIDTIKRIQKGENIENILNKDIVLRLYKLLPESYGNIEIIRTDLTEDITPETILNNLRHPVPDKQYIKNLILKLSEAKLPNDISNMSLSEKQTAIMKYLDNFTYVFSPESLSRSLKKIKEEFDFMEHKSGKKNLYYIPHDIKSNVLINYMYQKANGLDSSSFTFDIEDLTPKNNIIILDDMSISGQSQMQVVKWFHNDILTEDFLNTNFYFYSIISANPKLWTTDANCHTRTLYTAQDAPEKIYKTFTGKECSYLKKFASTYKNGIMGIGMPYMLPDNNSYISATILSPMLYKNTRFSNKGIAHSNLDLPDVIAVTNFDTSDLT